MYITSEHLLSLTIHIKKNLAHHHYLKWVFHSLVMAFTCEAYNYTLPVISNTIYRLHMFALHSTAWQHSFPVDLKY